MNKEYLLSLSVHYLRGYISGISLKYINRTYYSEKKWHYRFIIEAMMKLIVVMHFRKHSYDKTIFSLTESDIRDIGFIDSQDRVILPSPSTLRHFMKYRLGVTGTKRCHENDREENQPATQTRCRDNGFHADGSIQV
jgi:hypothetical protein